MTAGSPDFQLKLADCDADIRAAQRLRYEVFVSELGGSGTEVDHVDRLEKDQHDPFFDHLLLLDRKRCESEQVIGAYRLLRSDQVNKAGGYYSASEYDLSRLTNSGRRLLELGRSCLHRDYRGGTAMFELWNGLADYVEQHRIELMFGVASFHGTDLQKLAPCLSLLHHWHLAPHDMRVRAHDSNLQRMDLLAREQIDRRAAMVAMPALIKGYLRLGGCVGEGAFVDYAFNTVDVCLVMDTKRMNTRQRELYTRNRGAA